MNAVRLWIAELSVAQLAWLELLVKTTLVLLVARGLHAALVHVNPRWRRLLWRTTAVGLVVVAASVAFPPLVSWAILPAPAAGDVVAAAPNQTPTAAEPATPLPAKPDLTGSPAPAKRAPGGFDFSPQSPMLNHLRRQQAADFDSHPPRTADVAVDEASPSVHEKERAATAQLAPRPRRLAGLPAWIVAAWLAGIGLVCARTALGIRRLASIRRRAVLAPDWVQQQATTIAAEFGCSRTPEVLETDRIASPCVMGVRRPFILLPKSQCEPEHAAELPAILAHEIAHVRGHDVAWQLLLHGVAGAWWFHPLAWRMRSAHAAACDAVCDAVAATHVGDVAAYGRTLARLAIRVMVPRAATGIAMAHSSNVRRRIESLHRRVFPFGLSRGRAVCAVVTGLAMFALLGVFALTHAQAEPPETEKKPQPAPAATPEPEPADAKAEERDGTVMEIKVRDDAGQPVENVQLKFTGRVDGVRFLRSLQTDENGIARLEIQGQPQIRSLQMESQASGLAPVYYRWSGENRAVELPASVEVPLAPSGPIDGVVRDEQGQPVEGADVTIYFPITWPKLDSWVFDIAKLKTDAQGRWHFADAPLDVSAGSVRVEHSDFRRNNGRFNNSNSDRQCEVVLERGLVLTGRVTDAEGKPIRDALARAGHDRFGTDEPVAHTDADGRFKLANCKPGASAVTVQADGYAPELKQLTIGTTNEELSFQLQPGHTMRVRVVDPRSEPLEGVFFCTDTWRGFRTLELRVQTDAEGRVEWHSAPPDSVLCDLFKTGHMSVRETAVQAGDEETVIMLPDELILSGKVTDAATGKPIETFGVREGYVFQNSDQVYWSHDEPAQFSDGTYRFKFTEPKREHLLEFVAQGYLPAQSPHYKSTDGKQTFDVKLTPGSGPAGVVLTTEAKPAAGAEIAVARQGSPAYVQSGRFYRGQAAPTFVADEAGKVILDPQDDNRYRLIAIHDSGYAEMSGHEFADSHQVQLKPWGKIEGRVMRGRQPDAGRDVSYQPKRDDSLVWFDYKTKTDDDGQFTFARVVPGQGSVCRVVVTEFIKSWQNTPSWQVPLDVPPDGSVAVLVGGTGRPVVGQIALDRQPEVDIIWTANAPVQILLQEDPEKPRTHFRCAGNLDASGRFDIPDVPAGKYQLRLDVNNPPAPNACGAGDAIGRATFDFEVPPMTDNRSDEPLDLGTITAELFDTLDAGEQAPDFVLNGFDGSTVRLRDYRGKLVVLDFWATWCGPCLAEMPAFRDIHKQFGDNQHFAMISLACDQQPGPVRTYLRENPLPWTHADAGAAGSGIGGIARKYTVRSLPGTFLIGPDGRVIAKNLRGEELKKAIAAALADDELFQAAADSAPPARFPLVRFEADATTARTAPAPALLVFDDVDPTFDRDKPQHDVLRAYSADGQQLWAVDDLSTCQTVGTSGHAAIDDERRRIYAIEALGNRLLALDFEGRKLWQIGNIEAGVVALDSQTGNVWVSGGSLLNQGETVVIDPDGAEIAAFPYRAIDMACDAQRGVVWLAGYEVMQLDRAGKVRFRMPIEGWCCATLALDPADGSAWAGERKHPDQDQSRNRLWHLDAAGKVISKIDLGDVVPGKIARNPANGELWVSAYPYQILRVSPEGELLEPLKIEARYIAFGREDSAPWAATEKELLRLGPDGKVRERFPREKPSQQTRLTAF